MTEIDIHAPRYVRIGECNGCDDGVAACCQDMAVHFDEDASGVCPHLTDENKCDLYGKPERPDCCVNFPENPPIVFKKCSYRFLDTWNDNKELETLEI